MSAARQRAILYLPLPEVGDTRPLKAVASIEALFPDCALSYSYNGDNEFVRVDDRNELLSQLSTTIDREVGDGGIFFLSTDDRESHAPLVTASGLTLPAVLVPGGKAVYEMSVDLPLESPFLEKSANLLAELGPTVRAYWGELLGDPAATRLPDQASLPPDLAPPALQLPKPWNRLTSPWIPDRVGWLNYWSRETATLLGFPDPTLDAELLQRSKQTTDGGWVIAVTEGPLDLDNPGHVEALKRLYARFPQIGGRDMTDAT